MKNLIKNTILVAVMVVLGLFLTSCSKKDDPKPQLESRVDYTISIHTETTIKIYDYAPSDTLYVDMEVYGEKFTRVLTNWKYNTDVRLEVKDSKILRDKPFDESKIAPIKIKIRRNSDKRVEIEWSNINYQITVEKYDYDPKINSRYNAEMETRVLKLYFKDWDIRHTEEETNYDYVVREDYML